jgi:SprT-like protein
MNIEQLTQLATDFLRKNYDLSLEIPIKINGRLRISMGRYISTFDDKPNRIELAGFLLQYGANDVIIDTLYHECVHYALHVKDEPNADGNPHFESELRKYGVGSTKTNQVGLAVVYSCCECGKEEEAWGKRLLRDHHYRVTRCCRAKINIVGERIYNGTEAL